MPEVDNEVLAGLAKSQEGIFLTLSALSDEIVKMNEHNASVQTEKQAEEEAELEKQQQEVQKQQYSQLIKDVSAAVVKQLQDLGGDEEKKVSGTSWPMSGNSPNSEDESTEASALDNATEHDAQKPIAAMEKQYGDMDEEEDAPPMDDSVMDEGSAEYPMGEDLPNEDDYSDEQMKRMARMVKELTKANQALTQEKADLKQNQKSLVKNEVSAQLKKAGFREETGLRGPRLIGTDEVPIVKSEDKAARNEKLVDQLTAMSWSDLANLRVHAESGVTEGLPQELINNRS